MMSLKSLLFAEPKFLIELKTFFFTYDDCDMI